MTINKIDLGKVYNKGNMPKKEEKQVPVYENNDKQTVLPKLRGVAAAQYLAMLGLLATTGTFTSCIESNSESYAESDNEAMMKMMQTIVDALNAQTDVLNKILVEEKQNNADNKILIDIANKQLKESQQISKICLDVSNDVKDIKTATYEIRDILAAANENDEEFLAKLDIIIDSNLSDSEKLQQLIDLNTEQNAWLVNIATLIGDLKAEGSDLGDKFEKFYNDYTTNSAEFKDNDKDHTALMQLIYAELQKNTADNAELKAKLDAIIASGASDSEKLAELIKLVGSIDMKMDIVIDKIGELATEVGDLKAVLNSNNDAILAELVKGNANLEEANALQKENNQATIKIAQNTDEIIAKMNQFGDKFFSLDELKDMLGPMFKEVVDKIPSEGITAAELSAILEGYKTDLTKTNSLIENLTAVVKNLNLGSGSGITPEQLQALTDAIEAFRQQEGANDAAQMEAYQKIMDEIAGLKGGVEALADAMDIANTNYNKFAEAAKSYGDEFISYLQQLRRGQEVELATLEAYAQRANDAAVQAQQARNEQIVLLQAILNKEVGGNGGGLTKEELEEVLAGLGLDPKDYSTVLEEIRDAIGNVITSDDLQNFYLKTQPDLTKTNALIETLIDVLKNKNFSVTGDVNVNMKDVESLLGQIYDLMAQGKSPTSDQIAALQDAVDKIVANTGSTTAKASKISKVDMFAFYDAVNALNGKFAVDAYNA